jgi:hypothetical protein
MYRIVAEAQLIQAVQVIARDYPKGPEMKEFHAAKNEE